MLLTSIEQLCGVAYFTQMGGSSFQRPVGAEADVKELEYISALHQTGDVLREDGSIIGKSCHQL